MKVVVACDHRGFEAKRRLSPVLTRMGHAVTDLGCDGTNACDYPDFGLPAARASPTAKADVAILMDGSGIGMSVVANKVAGVRAALAHDEMTARLRASRPTATCSASAPACSARSRSAGSSRSS